MDIEKLIKSNSKKYNRYAAVLVPIVEENGEKFILFEVRAHSLRSQPGEICFPGGKIEKGETPKNAAIRESCEELGIEKEKISVISELEMLIRYDNMVIYPFVAFINEENFNINRGEVDHLFKIPISFFKEYNTLKIKNNLTLERGEDFPYELIKNRESYSSKTYDYITNFYIYEDYVIWGMTAEILKRFLECIY